MRAQHAPLPTQCITITFDSLQSVALSGASAVGLGQPRRSPPMPTPEA
jgi:hypothetical protein